MTDQTLQPFAPPTAILEYLPSVISVGAVIEWFLYTTFAFWTIYTVIAVYHWLKYSHASWVAFPAIATHIFVSFALMVYILSGDIIV